MLLFKSSLISTLLILLSFCINTGCKNSSVQNINNPADIKHFNSAQPNEIFAYLGPIVMNNTKYWPGDEIKLSVPFMVTGLSNSKQVNLNISVCIKDINKQSKKISVKQQNNEVFFNFILPERISEGYKTVTVELRSNKSLDSFTTKIFVYKPKIHISRVIAKPEIINPGELITLYGYYQLNDLKPNTKAKVHTSFSGNYINTVQKENIIGEKFKKIHTAVYHFPVNCEEGTYIYRFMLKSDYGSYSKTGTFTVKKK